MAWTAIGCSVRGAAHVKDGLPNQDAVAWWPGEGRGPPLAIAVSDGHGSPKCFRSDVGARLAVQAALDVLAVGGSGEEIVRRWRDAVEDELRREPFSEAELVRLAERDGPSAVTLAMRHPRLAYGATLLAALVREETVYLVQIGDGDLLCVSASGEVSRPVPSDEKLFGNETASLCSESAERDLRTASLPVDGGPVLLLLATDGYTNSFRTDDGFLQVGRDLQTFVREDGLESVASSLAEWLHETSASGSGDDITLGLLCRTEAL